MKEYLFRGKRVDNGEWVEGGSIINAQDGNIWIIPTNGIIQYTADSRKLVYVEAIPVVPETVCEFTGLTDKNGKKIFEGDIIETQEYYDKPYSAKKRKKRYIGIVEYVTYKHNNGIYYEAKWYVNIKDFDTYVYGAWSRFYDCTVIGNIHDNPELLEEDKQ